MLRTTNVKNELAWAWVMITTLFVSNPCLGQEDSYQESTTKPQAGVLERLFGNSSNQGSQSQKSKPKVPAETTAGKPARSGFLVPLKSFSRAFRGPSENEDSQEFAEMNPPRVPQPAIQREPFKNLPRAQERRDRDTIDLRVDQFTSEPPKISSRKTETATKAAPIVTADKKSQSTSVPLNSNSKTATSKHVTTGLSKQNDSEIAIESNSTSRRTAMELDTVETATPIQPASLPREKQNPQSKNRLEPKNLVDIGQPLEKPSANLLVLTNQDKVSNPVIAKQNADNATLPQTYDVPKISRPSNTSVAKQETKDKPLQSNSTQKSSNAIAASSIHREMGVPGVKVTVNGPSSILVNEEGRYEVIAKNEGTEILNGLIVQVAVPAQVAIGNVVVTDGAAHPDNDQGGNTIIWEVPQIPAGSSKTATLMLKTPKAEHFALGVEWTVLPQNAEMKIEVQQPQLAIALEGPSEVIFGKPQMYRIRVRNTGNADVSAISVVMTAEQYGSNQSDIGDIVAGSERIVEVELTFQQSGLLPIVAKATSAISNVEARSAIDVQVRQSELIATWFGPTEFYQGSVIDYELELSNNGSIPAVETNCTIKLPSGTDVVALPPGASRNGDSIKWSIKKLDPQEKITIPLQLNMSRIGDNQLAFSAECSSSAVAKAEFKTNIDAIADLHLTVVDPAAPAPVGQPVVYEVVISNRGKKVATDVEVIAQFSDGIEPVHVEGHSGRIVPGQAIFNSIPSIGPNSKLVLRIHAEASKPGVHRFRVEVKSKGSDTDLLEEESTRYLATSIKGDRR